VILRALLTLLLGWAAWRFVRGLVVGHPPAASPRTKGPAGSPRLDPDRAVSASWSEVEEEKTG
jgi:hypothetical protein